MSEEHLKTGDDDNTGKGAGDGGKGRGGGGQPVDHGAGGEHEDDTARKDKMGGNQYGAPPVVGAEARPGANEDYGRLELTRRGEGGAYGETTFGQDDDGTEMERVDDNDRRPVRRDNRPSLEETARKKMARLAYSALGLSVLGLVGLSVMIAGVALGWFGKSTPEIDPPIAKDDESLGNQPGAAVTVDVLAVDEPGVAAIDPTTVMIVGAGGDGKRLAVKGEGTWTVDKASGKITFTPESGLTGNPEPIRYQVYDTVGNVSRAAKVTVTYDQAKPPAAPPMAKPIIVAGFSGVASGSGGTETPVTVDVPANVEKGDFGIDKASVVITNTMLLEGEATPTSQFTKPTNQDGNTIGYKQLTVTGQGVWTVDDSGKVTFTPEQGFTGSPTVVLYSIADVNGNRSARAEIVVNAEVDKLAKAFDGLAKKSDTDFWATFKTQLVDPDPDLGEFYAVTTVLAATTRSNLSPQDLITVEGDPDAGKGIGKRISGAAYMTLFKNWAMAGMDIASLYSICDAAVTDQITGLASIPLGTRLLRLDLMRRLCLTFDAQARMDQRSSTADGRGG